jgi:Zn-dependent protease
MTAPARSADESGHGVRIARVGGVPVYLAPSWFLIAVVIVVIVAGPVLDSRPVFGIAVGLVQALLLLVCVLVHEAAHALSARAFGMPVLRIVANVWGGHTSMEAVRTTPGRMAAVAAAGPLANAALALVGWLALPDGSSGSLTVRILQGMVIINGTLAVLNLLPGMPLDGGQVVECLVWKATGDRNRGAVVAGWCGRVVTVLVVLWFFVRPIASGQGVGFASIWVLVIASVLWAGASESIRRGSALGALARLTVGDVVRPAVLLGPDATVAAALARPEVVVAADERGVPCLVFLTAAGEVPRDIEPAAPLSAAVMRLPDPCVVEATPEDEVLGVVGAMQATSCPTVVVTQGGRPWGIAHSSLVNQAAQARRSRTA